MVTMRNEIALKQVKVMTSLGIEYEERAQDRFNLADAIMARDLALLINVLAAQRMSKKSTRRAA